MTKEQRRRERLRKANLRPVQAWIHIDDNESKRKIKSLCKAYTVRAEKCKGQ